MPQLCSRIPWSISEMSPRSASMQNKYNVEGKKNEKRFEVYSTEGLTNQPKPGRTPRDSLELNTNRTSEENKKK